MSKIRQSLYLVAVAVAFVAVFVSIRVKADYPNESLPTLSGTKAIEYLKQNRQYDSLKEAFEATRKGQTDETPTEDAFGQPAKLTAADGAAGDFFGYSVAISGGTAIVGAPFDNVGQGSAYIFVRSGTTWSQQQKLTAADGAIGEQFGIGVAISGDTAIVGASEDNVGGNTDQGSAYIFVRSGTTWSQQQKLTAADGSALDRFGIAVAISGETVSVGAVADDVGANNNQGSAYIFVRSGTAWSEQQKLTAADGAAEDRFGSVAISGETAIVGAWMDDVGANVNQGSAYIFVRSGTTWSEQQKLTASDGSASDSFGLSVAISGETAIVGAILDDIVPNNDQGSAYIFVRSGTTWSRQQKVIAADGAEIDYFGWSVAISGETAIVAASLDDIGSNGDQGSAYIFVRSGTVWSQQQKLTAADGAAEDQFGLSVAISGETAIVGAFLGDGGANADQGSAFVFRLKAPFDFDGDGKSDISIYRPTTGEWWYLRSSDGGNRGFNFGGSPVSLTPADFTGDGKTDIAFFVPPTGQWFVLRSEDSTYYAFPFGASGDIPAPADFDADGEADPTVYRPSAQTWFILRSTGGVLSVPFGLPNDIPVPADYDGDGLADVGIYRPDVGQWWNLRSSDGGVYAATFGSSTDKPTPGDFSGDGKADVAFFRPSTGEWYVLRSEDQSFFAFPFGATGDKPAPADYDGDGRFDAAVFRPSDTNWYINQSTGGLYIQQYGAANDIPLPGAFVP